MFSLKLLLTFIKYFSASKEVIVLDTESSLYSKTQIFVHFPIINLKGLVIHLFVMNKDDYTNIIAE